jgi:uncharacterized protein (TIGR03437 family)
MRLRWLALLGCAAPLWAQSARVPVVLLNGYQSSCSGVTDSSTTFGSMESLLVAGGWQVAFFNNCLVDPGTTGSARPDIEQLAQAFGDFLNTLGAPEVDVVAHSMGGLIVRAWLAGKQPGGTFSPPAVVRIRKAVFIATPHAGALAIAGIFGANDNDSQAVEMFAGSSFLWDLMTWNQRKDDLRGIDALSIAGNNGGSGTSAHSNDGVVAVTSASLAASLGANRVRVLPYCHVGDLPSLLCSGPGIALITGPTHPTYLAVTSFLLGTTAWQTIGADATEDPVLSQHGGILLEASDSFGNPLPNPGSATLASATQKASVLPWNSEGVSFADFLTAGPYQFALDGATYPLAVSAGGHFAVEVKQGPEIALVAPVAGSPPSLTLAPGELIAIYGSDLQNASVTIGGTRVPTLYDSEGQIDTIVPALSTGLVSLSVTNPSGQDTLNVLLEPVAPAIFSADGSGTGAALVFHAADFSPVSVSSPALAGETISIFLTGLGVPVQIPVLQADGADVEVVQLASVSGSEGVERLDFVAPASTGSSVTLQASAGGVASNTVTLYVAP